MSITVILGVTVNWKQDLYRAGVEYISSMFQLLI